MHWRYRLRKQQLLDECEVPPEVFQGGIERLAEFAQAFAACLVRKERREHAHTYPAGLVSDLKRKNAESIAYRHDQDRHGLQHFVGALGMGSSALDPRTGRPGGPRDRYPRWSDHL